MGGLTSGSMSSASGADEFWGDAGGSEGPPAEEQRPRGSGPAIAQEAQGGRAATAGPAVWPAAV